MQASHLTLYCGSLLVHAGVTTNISPLVCVCVCTYKIPFVALLFHPFTFAIILMRLPYIYLISSFCPSKNRCTAMNKYSTKPAKSKRSHWSILHVLNDFDKLSSITAATSTASIASKQNERPKLLDPLQSSSITIIQGQHLRLLCALTFTTATMVDDAAPRDIIKWTFTSRQTSIPVALENIVNQVDIVNATQQLHDGVYNCSTSTDSQVGYFIWFFFHVNLSFFVCSFCLGISFGIFFFLLVLLRTNGWNGGQTNAEKVAGWLLAKKSSMSMLSSDCLV